MNRNNIFPGLAVIALLAGAGACKGPKAAANAAADCEGVICTKSFAAVAVTVQDAKGYPARLDSAATYNASGARVHRVSGNASGMYTVLDDSYRKQLAMRQEAFSFRGYRGGREVIREKFSIGADCCHVNKVSGPDVLSLK